MKIALLTTAMLWSGLIASATLLSPEEAWNRVPAVAQKVKGNHQQQPVLTVMAADCLPAAYLFSIPDGGFTILSADDVAAPILGYSDERPFDIENLPCAFEAWLDFYAERIRWARELNLPSYNYYNSSGAEDRTPIGPLCTTTWGQKEPFNNLLPEVGGDRVVTGCVATALAQVLNYHGYPISGTGNHGVIIKTIIDHSFVEIPVDFDFENTEFDWEVMRDYYEGEDYSEREALAVATLMKGCGVAVDMNYGTGASGAIAESVPRGLYNYLRLNPGVRCTERDCYYNPEVSWDDYVYSRLQEQGALLYCGVTSANEAHAFVCDGYSGDGYFHFNWGWNGVSDGWFRLDSLNPEVQGTGGSAKKLPFNFQQNILDNFNPGAEGETFVPHVAGYKAAVSISQKEQSLGKSITVSGEIRNLDTEGHTVEFGLMMAASELDESEDVISVDTKDMPSYDLWKIYKRTTLPNDLAEGCYCLRPAMRLDGETDWHLIQYPVEYGAWIWMEVKDGTASFGKSGASGVDSIYYPEEKEDALYTPTGLRVKTPARGQIVIREGKAVIER